MRINTRVHRRPHRRSQRTPHDRNGIAVHPGVPALFDGRPRWVALDLGDVPYIDSVGLGAIVQAYTSARRRGGDLKLLRTNRRIGRLLAITRLYTVLKSYDTEDEVERSFDTDCHAAAALGPIRTRFSAAAGMMANRGRL